MLILLLSYWVLTTTYGTYWLIKHPSDRRYEDSEYVTLLEIIAHIVPCALIAWLVAPMMLLHKIKFKR